MMDSMEEPWLQKYIPAGCLKVTPDDYNIPPASDLEDWKFFTRDEDDALSAASTLSQATQSALLNNPILSPFTGLFHSRWIQLQVKLDVIRVYILPHDIDRRAINRSEGKLSKAMSTLLVQLDFSPASWNGVNAARWDYPLSHKDQEQPVQEDDLSLLDRFNRVPSPSPQLNAVPKDDAATMQAILNSQIPGLQTTLYRYQRRSAALLLRKELNPGRVVDPRLRPALDQYKQQWFYDSVTGLVLRSPRYYDGVRGGIIAEEMGTGKTIICLALILATKSWPTDVPEPLSVEVPARPKLASLMDMAAAAVNRHAYPWKLWRDRIPNNCVKALERTENRALYEVRNPLFEPRKGGRVKDHHLKPTRKVHLSTATLIIVPSNLVPQWEDEVKKHTTGLSVLIVAALKDPIPPTSVLLAYDIVIFSHNRFEKIARERSNPEGKPIITHCPLEYMRFKRCIIDEGHKIGNGGQQWKSDLVKGLDNLEIAARWVVTGTPGRAMYGVNSPSQPNASGKSRTGDSQAASKLEQQDLQRIGNIASKFLKVRPWCNTRDEVGDTPASWSMYVMQPAHSKQSGDRKDCLKSTLESLIIRHQLSEVQPLLPPVDKKVVILEGSYQDKLSLNLFSMMIVMNAVQSQRTDIDYLFQVKQRGNLLQLVNNLKQASFFGGVFFSAQDIVKALDTAEGFMKDEEIPISPEDHVLLRDAIDFGYMALRNRLKDVSNQYHSMPIFVEHFPGGHPGKSWSLDEQRAENQPVLTDAALIAALQKFISPCIDSPTSLRMMIDSGSLADQGRRERSEALAAVVEMSEPQSAQVAHLAGNTPLGNDRQAKPKTGNLPKSAPITENEKPAPKSEVEIAGPLAKTRIISTVSAKLSYLIDYVSKYMDEDQIIIFYENDNVAYYISGVFETLQIEHLIYTRKGLSADRRAQYVATFTHTDKFRVLLMDISQAAFGLDMRSVSRVIFISPVLNPQVEAQAIGRARRISQQKPVSVEILVLKDSIEEVMIERSHNMTAAEHRKVKTILDDQAMFNWILNAKLLPLPHVETEVEQTAMLQAPQFVFGRGFGRTRDPDADLLTRMPEAKEKGKAKVADVDIRSMLPSVTKRLKRTHKSVSFQGSTSAENDVHEPPKQKRRIRVVFE